MGSSLQRAFTIIEIIIVVLIMGIAAAMIVGISSGTDSTRVTMAGRRLLSDLEYARGQSLVQQRTIYVIFDSANQKYTVAYKQSPSVTADYVRDPSIGGNFVVQFGNGGTNGLAGTALTAAGLGSGNTVLAFNPLGQPLVGTNSGTPSLTTQVISVAVSSSKTSNKVTLSISPLTGEFSCSGS
jgi:prepilin-type N-terminal cleavage/methylation domain-containing protein